MADRSNTAGLGATHYRWRADVARTVQQVHRRFSPISANTYVAHPWPGWSHVSVDYWGPGGRGDPIREDIGREIREFLFDLPGAPMIRHTIFQHQLWTSYGGVSYWRPDDHSGALRHLHVTYWR
jgi:hypothetical protein